MIPPDGLLSLAANTHELGSLARLAHKGLLSLAANTHELGSLAELAHKGIRLAGRTGAVLEQGGLPPEYPTLAALPSDRYLQVCLLRVS